MGGLICKRVTLTWLCLVSATLLSWCLGHDLGGLSQVIAANGVLLITVIKMYLVVMEFMEIRRAPNAMRWIARAWLILLLAALMFLYAAPDTAFSVSAAARSS